MTTSITTKCVAAAALAVAALSAASAAHARSDVQFSIAIGIPPVYVQPGPVHVQPWPVYVQPAPVYDRPRTVYVQPAPIYVQPAPYGYFYENGRDWRREQWERRHFRHHRGWDRGNGRNWD